MFTHESTETNQFERKSKLGKVVLYSRTCTIYHYACDSCGTMFRRHKNGVIKQSRKTFCSECLANNTDTIAIINVAERMDAKAGTIKEKKNGYREIYIGKNYPYNRKPGCIRMHVYVMEQHIQRKIEQGEVVHHIDGDKRNNDLSNLFLTTVEEHNRLHARSELIIFELVKRGVVRFNREIGRYELSEQG